MAKAATAAPRIGAMDLDDEFNYESTGPCLLLPSRVGVSDGINTVALLSNMKAEEATIIAEMHAEV